MKKIIQSASLLLTLFISSTVVAGTISDKSLSELMALSGLNKQVASLPEMVGAGVAQARQQGAPIPDAEFAEVKKSIVSAFKPSVMISAVGKEIKNNVTESGAKKLLVWYKSSLGKKITKAEEDASTAAAYQQMMKEAQTLLADKKRVKIAQELDRLVNATDMAMQLQESSGVAVYTAVTSALNPGKPVNIEPYLNQVKAQQQQMRANIQQLVMVSFVYSYKTIKIAEMQKYLKFLKRPHTKKFNDSVIKGMNSAFNQSISKMAKSLAQTFKKYAKKK